MGEVSLIISLGPACRAQAVPDADELSEFTSFVVGLQDRPSRTAHDGRQLGIQVRLDPLGAFLLLGVPLHELGNGVVELSGLLGSDADRWMDMLLAAPTWEERFAVLDGLLAGRTAAGPVPAPELVWAWRTMQRAAGVVRVADLADGAGCSHRQLIARFREQHPGDAQDRRPGAALLTGRAAAGPRCACRRPAPTGRSSGGRTGSGTR